jgi:hypothetical protein
MSESTPTEPAPSEADEKQSAPPKRRIRKGFLKILGLLFVLTLGYNAFRSWQAGSELESRLVKLREQGAPLTLDELQTPALSEEDNAQTWIRRAKPHTDELSRLLNDYQSSEEFQSRRPNPEQVDVLKKAFEAHAEVWEFYARAAECSGLQSDWRFGAQPSESLELQLDSTSETRAIIRHCSSRVGLLIAEDNFDEALDLSLQMLALTRSLDHQPMLVGYLVGLACRTVSLSVMGAVLERSPLTDEQRQQIDSALAECESPDAFRHALASERIFGLATFRSDIFGGPMQSMVMWKFKFDARDYLDLFGEMDGWASKPRYEISAELNGITSRENGVLTTLVTPALLQVRNAHDRILSRVRCVRVLNALQRELAENISDATALSEFPGMEDFRLDPFTGNDLLLGVSDDSIVVYSVGIDLTDDGGSLDDQKDHGIRIELKDPE